MCDLAFGAFWWVNYQLFVILAYINKIIFLVSLSLAAFHGSNGILQFHNYD